MALHSIDIISLCSGGGGLDLGLELAVPSARTVLYVERESFAVAHLVAAMQQGVLAEAPVWSDAKSFDGRPWRGFVDGLIGGIPCQPHSLAGRKGGQLDERDLWSDARRIIVQSRPWFVLIENVSGMLAAGADEVAGAERVWRDLRKLGFAVEGGLFTAAEVGASHQRERLFILGVRPGVGLANSCGGGQLWGPQPDVGQVEPKQQAPRRGDAQRRNSDAPAGDPTGVGQADPYREHDHRSGQRGQGRRGQPADGSGEAPGVGLADAYGERLEGVGPDGRTIGREDARGPTGLRSGAVLEHAIGGGHGRREEVEIRRSPRRAPDEWPSARLGTFPPGPADGAVWSEIGQFASELLPAVSRHDRFRLEIGKALAAAHGDPAKGDWLDEGGPHGLRASIVQDIAESTLRGVADGLAAARVDWLRLLGNGVVPLEAAHAFRTLVTRLAARGAAGADELVRVMA